MTASTGAPASGVAAGADGPVWHTLNADRVLEAEKVDEQSGLSSAEAASRAERFGPNKFDAGTVEPRWRAFLRQYTDLMQIVLTACTPSKPSSSLPSDNSTPAALRRPETLTAAYRCWRWGGRRLITSKHHAAARINSSCPA